MVNVMGKLPKQDIQFIDNYLKNSGVTLVDVRLEMVDHIASDIERKLENKEEETFYDAFKGYMVKGKKTLLDEYELEKSMMFDKNIIGVLKAFIAKDSFLVFLTSVLIIVLLKESFFEFFNDYNLLLALPALVMYVLLYKKYSNTTITSSILIIILLPVYLWLYFKTPFHLFFIILIYLINRKVHYKLKLNVNKSNAFMYYFLFSVVIGFLFVSFSSLFKEWTNPTVEMLYYAFQLTHWYVVFKQIFKYKKELDTKYKMLLGV